MKKVLNEESFSTAIDVGVEAFFNYLDENGEWTPGNPRKEGWDTATQWVWYRRQPREFEYNFLTHEDLIKLQLDGLLDSKENDGTLKTGISIETYNTFVLNDAWLGGEVEDFGYIAVAASSLYGNSIYLPNGSWYSCGTSENPVNIAKFYQLVIDGKWHGGYVDTWGNVSSGTTLLGTSAPMVRDAKEGEETLGTIANVDGLMGGYDNLRILREQFKDFWNETKKCYEIDDKTIEKYLKRYKLFGDNLKDAIKKYYPIFLRKIAREEVENGVEKNYGEDVILVNYNYVKGTYDCINSVGPTIEPILEKDISNQKIKIETFIIQKS